MAAASPQTDMSSDKSFCASQREESIACGGRYSLIASVSGLSARSTAIG